MAKGDQQKFLQWIEKILDLDRRFTKDERLYDLTYWVFGCEREGPVELVEVEDASMLLVLEVLGLVLVELRSLRWADEEDVLELLELLLATVAEEAVVPSLYLSLEPVLFDRRLLAYLSVLLEVSSSEELAVLMELLDHFDEEQDELLEELEGGFL